MNQSAVPAFQLIGTAEAGIDHVASAMVTASVETLIFFIVIS